MGQSLPVMGFGVGPQLWLVPQLLLFVLAAPPTWLSAARLAVAILRLLGLGSLGSPAAFAAALDAGLAACPAALAAALAAAFDVALAATSWSSSATMCSGGPGRRFNSASRTSGGCTS